MYGKGNKAKATKLHSQLIRSIGSCERCGSSSALQAAHIIGRKYGATRCLLNNAWCLCASCHRKMTDWPKEHLDFVADSFAGEIYGQMEDWARASQRFGWPRIPGKFSQPEWGDEFERLKKFVGVPLFEARESEWQSIMEAS